VARSTYIYVLLDAEDHHKLAVAFTVKHEMVTWLTRNPGDYTIYRLSDGGHKPPEVMWL